MIAYTNYNEELEEDENVIFRAEDQEWDDATIKELKEKYHVIYTHGIQATMLVKSHYDGRILLAQGFEDDGCIQFPRRYNQFDHMYSPYWLDSNIKLLQVTKEFVEDVDKAVDNSELIKDVDW